MLVATNSVDLMALIRLVKQHCDNLKLEISVEKCQVVSPEDKESWDIREEGEIVLSLKSVLSYKYLGTETTLSMKTTGSKKQKKCIKTAQRYGNACHYVGKTGPDVMDFVILWVC